jgi:hypothetical protein
MKFFLSYFLIEIVNREIEASYFQKYKVDGFIFIDFLKIDKSYNVTMS